MVIISEGGLKYYLYPNGATFSYSRLTCGQAALTVKGVNTTDLVESNELSATHGIVNDFGNISVCGNQVQNYLILTVDGETATFVGMEYETWSQGGFSNTNIFLNDSLQLETIFIGFDGDTTGDYSNANFVEVIQSSANGWNLQGNNPQGFGFTTFEVTEYGPNIIGTFSGQLINTTFDPTTGNTTTEIVDCSGEFNLVL